MNETPTRLAAAPARRWAETWAALRHDIVGAWRYALARNTSERIDDATLRDIGLDRSELGSYHAELDGRAAVTRRRVVAPGDGVL